MSRDMSNHSRSSGSGRATSSHGSATQRARDYFREKLYGNSPQGFIDVKPFPGQITQVGLKTELLNHNTATERKMCRVTAQAERERRRRARARRSLQRSVAPTHGNTGFIDSGKASNITPELMVPRLRRVDKFERCSRTEHSSSSGASLYSKEDKPSIADMRKKHANITSGKLERVIPPSDSVGKIIRTTAKPPPLTWATLSGPYPSSLPNPAGIVPPEEKHTSTSQAPSSSTNHITLRRHSAIENLTNSADLLEGQRRSAFSNLASSADFLDATRRSITSIIRRGAEKTVHSLVHRGDDDGQFPSDDDESFYCIGESRELISHAAETPPSPVSSVSSWNPSSEPSRYSSELAKVRRLSPRTGDIWTDAETECRLCRKKSPAGIRGLCLDCEEEFETPNTRYVDHAFDEKIKPTPPPKIVRVAAKKEDVENRTNPSWPLEYKDISKRPVAKYVDYPFFDDIEPTAPLRIVKAAAKNRGFANNTKPLPPLNSEAKVTEPESISGLDPGPPPVRPLPKPPTKDAQVKKKTNTELRIRTAERRARLNEAPPSTSQEAVVQSVGDIVKSLRTKDRVVKRKKLGSAPTGPHESWQPPDLREAYNNAAKTSASDKGMREDYPEEVGPKIKGGENERIQERPMSLSRGSDNKKRPNSHGEWKKQEAEERDSIFYSFYDEILEEAKERPARARENGRG